MNDSCRSLIMYIFTTDKSVYMCNSYQLNQAPLMNLNTLKPVFKGHCDEGTPCDQGTLSQNGILSSPC